jgi:hypothetical protein
VHRRPRYAFKNNQPIGYGVDWLGDDGNFFALFSTCIYNPHSPTYRNRQLIIHNLTAHLTGQYSATWLFSLFTDSG